jgi:transcription-repair coupling factor (superfamily II helicase)
VSVDAYLPSDYIYDSIQKIEIYKKVASIRSIAEAEDLGEELVDRFGDLPIAVENLLAVARLKTYGGDYGMEQISQKADDWTLKLAEVGRFDKKKLDQLCLKFENRFKLFDDASAGGPPYILLRGKGLSQEQKLELLEKFLEACKDALKLKGALQDVAQ